MDSTGGWIRDAGEEGESNLGSEEDGVRVAKLSLLILSFLSCPVSTPCTVSYLMLVLAFSPFSPGLSKSIRYVRAGVDLHRRGKDSQDLMG